VLQARLTASQLAKLAHVPQGSLGLYITTGLLEPSARPTEGTGYPNLFGIRDLIIAMAISKMRMRRMSTEGMQKLAKFWRKLGDESLRATALGADLDAESARTSDEKVLMLLDNGRLVEDDNLPILELTRKHRSSVVHVVDPGLLANQALVDLTEDRLVPMPSGRLPRRPRQKGPAPRGDGPEPSQAPTKRATVQPKRGADKPSSNKTRRRGR